MTNMTFKGRAMRSALLAGAAVSVMVSAPLPAFAQEEELQEIIVTGSRIARPGLTSSSPVYSIGSAEIDAQQQPEVEKIIRILPVSIPGDGQNVNNGTAGVSSLDLRGLGPQRNLILIDGKRVTPYNTNGIVDVSQIPTALIERIDIVTGGASAVYGSDAMSGAVNFILKKDFEGVDVNYDFSRTGEKDGRIHSADVTMGANVDGGKGNVAMNINYSERAGVQFGKRPLGQLGIETATGAGLASFKAGQGPIAPPAGCGGTGSVAAGGSTTTVPTRIAIAGGPGLGQFREDGTLGSNCGVFNFNPFNYYQTPLERFGGTAIASYEINEHFEVYGRASFSSTNVRQQIAPSGIFGTTAFTPLANPFLSAQARQAIITAANTGRVAGTVSTTGALPNWRDLNSNGVVDVADDILISYRRRTVELGERSTTYDNNAFQFQVGLRGDLIADWTYDLNLQHGESDRANVSAGYTNVTNFTNAVNAVSTTACRTGGSACVPINVFGGEGTITPAAAAYSSATAIEKQAYEQTIVSAVVSGPLGDVTSPFADEPISFAFGTEYREEFGERTPDECLKLAPASCLGGAGGNTLPVAGGFNVTELFVEGIFPLVADKPFFETLDFETAYRWSDYDPTGVNRTWKLGLNWAPIEEVLFRVAKQKAARAPNVGELAAPVTASLQNATLDPCSVANPAALTNATLRSRCIGTGMTAAQVGTVEDIVAGQVNTFSGTNLAKLPKPEEADTLTVGVVLTPELGILKNPVLTVDYYKIDIEKVIGTLQPQEVLDGCYTAGRQDLCSTIIRVGGTLTLPGSGIQTFTTNLDYLKTEGVEVGASFGIDLEDLGADPSLGSLNFAWNANWYLTQESRSDALSPELDCLGRFGASCTAVGSSIGNPLPELRFVQRGSWTVGDLTVGYTWRFIGEVEVEEAQKSNVFDAFEEIPAYHYVDLNAQYQVTDYLRVQAGVTNVFERDPPIVGNEIGTTAANSGNTYPSMYDTLGRVYSVGFNVRF